MRGFRLSLFANFDWCRCSNAEGMQHGSGGFAHSTALRTKWPRPRPARLRAVSSGVCMPRPVVKLACGARELSNFLDDGSSSSELPLLARSFTQQM